MPDRLQLYLTAVIQGGQPKCSQVKSPTINLTILNQFYGYWEGLCKIFAHFICGKAFLFALKVLEFLRKCAKVDPGRESTPGRLGGRQTR